ncbi:hypothetical protein AC579_1183 [Pseudocercospora musae]|uniref:Uncharacterized protein n=1 Tax=Pseudocercospora musae TaxID=113226 RepID=A0A139HVT3_9PEZI|nr:hypothetical protein AC579_1183 [Pseudocercospora musae]
MAGVSSGTLYATGFNAFGQLQTRLPPSRAIGDVTGFQELAKGRILFACWSTTTFVSENGHIYSLGFQQIRPIAGTSAKCAIGDHDGMKGCMIDDRLYVVRGTPGSQQTLESVQQDDSPRIELLACAGNGRVAAVLRTDRLTSSNPETPLNSCHVVEFHSFDGFLHWFESPVYRRDSLCQKHQVSGQPLRLEAGTGTFILLMKIHSQTRLFSWGDNRFRALGRSPSEASPANRPGIVESLEEDVIIDVAAGGWMNAVVTAEGGLYMWGHKTEQDITNIYVSDLEGSGGDVVLADLPNGPDDEPLRAAKVALGSNHAAVVAGGTLLVNGDNSNGQLGMGVVDGTEEWEVVDLVATDVWCGSKCTFAVCH